jgi:hypothetical protein
MGGEFTTVPVFYGNGKELLFDPDYSISIFYYTESGEFNSFSERISIFRRFFGSRKFFAPLFSKKSGKTILKSQNKLFAFFKPDTTNSC